MTYKKNIWRDGDIITSDKLNHIEKGILDIAEANTVNGRVDDIEAELAITHEIVECAKFSEFTETDDAYNGLTIRQDTPGILTVYGTASESRRILCLNGQKGVKFSTSSFDKTLEAGHYNLSFSTSGYISGNELTWDITYSTFADAFEHLKANNNNLSLTFEQAVMIGFIAVSGRNFGTQSNPTYISFEATDFIARDAKARSEIDNLKEETFDMLKYSEQVLTYDEKMQSLINIDAACGSSIYPYNVVDLIRLSNTKTTSRNGITFTKNDNATWTITGTATSSSFCNIISSSASLPAWVVPGANYRLSFNGGSVPLQLFIYHGSTYTYDTYTNDADIVLPSDLTGIILRFWISSGESYGIEGETVNYTLVRSDVGGATINNSYTYNNTTNKTEEITNNTYTITTNPTITTDTHGWLAAIDTNTSSEIGKTDMTPAIMSMLNSTGYCHLGEGIFYVSGNIDMPVGSTIEGCGRNTIVRLLDSVGSGYTIKMQQYCRLSNLRLSGSYSNISPSIDGGRIGLLFAANSDGSEGGTQYTTSHCMISDVYISCFSGSGIKCHNTSVDYAKGLYAMNVYIDRCYWGINIDYRSEFNKFTNICIAWCYIACENNGGNNVFTACTFHATNTGFYINGSQPNAAHGTINGCTFCHIGSNSGVAIKCDDVTAGFVIANCQIWYNSIELTNCQGILFDGCEFGRGADTDGSVCASIMISGGNLVLFSGCIFHRAATRPPVITITNNTKTVFDGCYDTESGAVVTAG